jgi:hypothetical protein
MPPNSGRAMIVNWSSLAQTPASEDLICDHKETWKIKVDAGQVIYAEHIGTK